MSRLLNTVILLLGIAFLHGEDPYSAWSAGRPAESLPALHEHAQAAGTWDAWLDLGLCAIAANRRGPATTWLLEAHRRAPSRNEPRQALAMLGVVLPDSYSALLGPLAMPGSGIAALPLMILAGFLLGYAVVSKRLRIAALVLGSAALLAVAPGTTAAWLDGRRQWIGAASDTQLLDSTGAPLRAVPAGSFAERLPGETWNGRIAVRLPDGTQGWLAEADTRATP